VENAKAFSKAFHAAFSINPLDNPRQSLSLLKGLFETGDAATPSHSAILTAYPL
jgi:hypothetical protein